MILILILNASSKLTCLASFKTKFDEERVLKLNQMTELLIPSAWINPCYEINLILIASLAVFKTMCKRNINIIEQLSIWQRSMFIVFDHCLQDSESGGQTLRKNYWPHLICLVIYAYISYLYFFISYWPHLIYIPHLICLFTSFLLALNFVFSKIEMFKLLFILFVIKQLLGNLTSDIDIYSAKLSIIRLGKAKW